MKRIPEFDGLRALAVLAVIGCHYPFFARSLWGIPSFGWVGVDLFFSLSGFLITSILLSLRGSRTPFRTFYGRRLIRTLPPYWATVIVSMVLAWVSGHWQFITWKPIIRDVLFLHAFRLNPHPAILATHRLPRMLEGAHHLPAATLGLIESAGRVQSVFWSLSIEEWFYLLWAPIVLWSSKRQVEVIGVAICIIELAIRWIAFCGLTSYFLISYRFDALIYGGLAGVIVFSMRLNPLRQKLARLLFYGTLFISSLGLVLIAWSIWPILGREVRSSPLFMTVGLLCCGLLFSSVISLCATNCTAMPWWSRILRFRVLAWLGRISYMIYLTHVWVYTIVWWVCRRLLSSSDSANGIGPALAAVISLILTVAISQASWIYLEGPLLQLKDRFLPAPKSVR